MRVQRPSPVSIVALALVAVGLYSMTRDQPVPEPQPRCDPASGEECPPQAQAPVPGMAGSPAPTERPTLSAERACRNVGYLCAALSSLDRIRIQRWKDFHGTVVVHIPTPQLADRGLAQRLQRAASSGVRLWNGQPFPIVVDERGTRKAHFSVRWVSGRGGAQIGLARTRWSPQTGLQVVELELSTDHPYDGGAMAPDKVRLTAAHEMGHALGLPHSDQPRDVMYPTNTATTLSARDYRTLEALYDFEDGTEIIRRPE